MPKKKKVALICWPWGTVGTWVDGVWGGEAIQVFWEPTLKCLVYSGGPVSKNVTIKVAAYSGRGEGQVTAATKWLQSFGYHLAREIRCRSDIF